MILTLFLELSFYLGVGNFYELKILIEEKTILFQYLVPFLIILNQGVQMNLINNNTLLDFLVL